jgi:hypothetical protein
MDIVSTIKWAFHEKLEKGWEKLYFLVDLHGTVFRNYDKADLHGRRIEYQVGARETLREMTRRKDIHLILWTGTHKDEIEGILHRFEEDGIHFDNVNENPEVKDTEKYCADGKLYFNVGIDDRFGFDAESGDWKYVMVALLDNPEETRSVIVRKNLD